MIEIRHARRSSFISRKKFGCGSGPEQIICPPFWQGVPLAVGCPLGCSYCYLKLTLRHYKSRILVYNNPEDLLIQLKEFAKHHPGAVVNFGETADSMAMEKETGFLRLLRAAMSQLKEQDLDVHPLLITKLVYPLSRISKNPDGTIFCWSVTSHKVHKAYENIASSSPGFRLANAHAVKRRGHRVRIRIDPIVPPAEGSYESYTDIIETIKWLKPERVTIGTPRFFKGWANFADEKGRELYKMTRADGADGRRRLPFAQRLKIYRSFRDALMAYCPVALCKETRAMWQAVGLDWRKPECNCIP